MSTPVIQFVNLPIGCNLVPASCSQLDFPIKHFENIFTASRPRTDLLMAEGPPAGTLPTKARFADQNKISAGAVIAQLASLSDGRIRRHV